VIFFFFLTFSDLESLSHLAVTTLSLNLLNAQYPKFICAIINNAKIAILEGSFSSQASLHNFLNTSKSKINPFFNKKTISFKIILAHKSTTQTCQIISSNANQATSQIV